MYDQENIYSRFIKTYNPRQAKTAYLNLGYSFIIIVTIPTYGRNPRARPTTSFLVSQNCPGAYRPRSSTELLSPLVKNLTLPSSFSWSLSTLGTMGMSLPSTLNTTISPTRISSASYLVRKSRSPRWKAGSMDPESTTTIGDSEPVTTIKPFQIIKAEDTIMPKLST